MFWVAIARQWFRQDIIRSVKFGAYGCFFCCSLSVSESFLCSVHGGCVLAAGLGTVVGSSTWRDSCMILFDTELLTDPVLPTLCSF
jgi:hypothetical protein